MSLAADLAHVPAKPGVYLFRDARGTVLYVGKAASLRPRVRSYFQPGAELSPRIRQMVGQVASFDLLVTASEIEALILEANLVKEHQPRYNVRLRDDKHFPYLKLTAEPFPQLVECRSQLDDGARYFGPYVDAGAVRQGDKLLQQLFRIRSCTWELTDTSRLRPCLDYHLGLCDAPCAGLIDRATYNQQVDQAAALLRGEADDLLARLTADMTAAADRLEFEQAAKIRDLIDAVKQLVAAQRIVSTRRLDADVFAVAQHDDLSCVQAVFVRRGRVLGDDRAIFEGAAEEPASAPLAHYLARFYEPRTDIPPLILLGQPLDDRVVLAEWLTQRAGRRVEVSCPERGERRRLVELARENAGESLRRYLVDQDRQKQRAEAAISDLRDRLGLPRTPFRIECFDIATLQGEQNVGSMVVLEDGRPRKSAYRQFKIRATHDAPNDYAMMREVLTRRLERARAGDPKFLPLPDLLVVDGGRGQLQVALEVCRELDLARLPVAALAKRHEEIYLPDRPEPLLIEPRAASLRLLRALRDEAHRVANTFHQRLRRQAGLRSILDDIPGIGAARRTALLAHFRSTAAIAAATLEQLAAVPGMNRPAAERVKAWLTTEEAEEP